MKPANWTDIGTMDDLGRMDSPVHRVDPRAKAVVTLAFVVAVTSFPRYEVSALTPFLSYPVALMAFGRIPPLHIFRKVLVALPFALAIGILNPFLDRQPACAAGDFVVTGGWLSFASIMLRSALTVAAALAMVACTGMYRLCAGLALMGVPRLFVLQLLFLYRYLFVIADEGSRVLRSVEARAGRTSSLPPGTYGPLVGRLLLRAMDRAERIYGAMTARGFDGTVRTPGMGSFRPSDWAFVAGWILFFAAARVWNLASVLGTALAEIAG